MDKKISELQKKIENLEKQIEGTKLREEKADRLRPEGERPRSFEPLKVFYEWSAPQRVFVKRDKEWFLKTSFVALIFILISAMLQEPVIILVICVLVLIAFLLASIPPHMVKHQISNKGIKSIGTMYKEDELKEFWVAEKLGHLVVYVQTTLRIPSRLVLLISSKDEMKVVKELSRLLPYKDFPEKQGKITKLSEGVMVHPKRYLKLFKTNNTKKNASKVLKRKGKKKS